MSFMKPCWTNPRTYLGLTAGDQDDLELFHYFDENGVSACSAVAFALSNDHQPVGVPAGNILPGRKCKKCEQAIARRARIRRGTLTQQTELDRLAQFIMENFPGELSQPESTVDCAIRLLKSQLRCRLSNTEMERVNHLRYRGGLPAWTRTELDEICEKMSDEDWQKTKKLVGENEA